MLPHNHDGLIILFKFLNILIDFNISNINKEINKKLPEGDLKEDLKHVGVLPKVF